uniref:Class II aldolase/adducin N-terminal domain-containing protein n=1 Tax=Branchiostoma floridae TaxID=7739 RepID=C3XU68_BRAFL|eukprot:XP_002612433.1 hypothetical protein BRAFLDRAFT_75452 [Branchiostoma floridae]
MSVLTRLCRGAGLLKWSSPLITRGEPRGVGSTSTAQQADEDILRNAQKQNQQTRIDLATSYRAMEYYNLHMGVCNHLTALCPAANGEGTVMLLVPHGTHWSQVTASCLLGLNEKGALKDCTLRMIHQDSMRFYDNVAYDTEYDGFATTGEEGPRIASKLGDKIALILGNHGVLTVGQTVAVAFDHMYYMERVAMYQMLAMQTGGELQEIQPQVAARWSLMQEGLPFILPYAETHLRGFKNLYAKKSPEVLQ